MVYIVKHTRVTHAHSKIKFQKESYELRRCGRRKCTNSIFWNFSKTRVFCKCLTPHLIDVNHDGWLQWFRRASHSNQMKSLSLQNLFGGLRLLNVTGVVNCSPTNPHQFWFLDFVLAYNREDELLHHLDPLFQRVSNIQRLSTLFVNPSWDSNS